MMKRVVITGIGIISPLGIGKEEYWDSLKGGNSAGKSLDEVESSKLLDKHKFDSQAIAEVNFDFDKFKSPADIKNLDRYIQFAVAGATMAIEDSGITTFPNDYFGVSLSTAIGGTKMMEESYLKTTNNGLEEIDPNKVNPELYTSAMPNTPASIIAGIYQARGPCLTLATGCIGGLDAIGHAYETIKYGEADVMLAGATEAPITPITLEAFEVINCLSTKERDPKTSSRPFDLNRDGFVLSEGCGVLVLEEYERAVERGANIYAEIKGFSEVSNAIHMTDLSGEGEDLTRSINLALQDANLQPKDIHYINAHGSSTPKNDSLETKAIKNAFGKYAYNIPINSTKSMAGHPLAAATSNEIIACLLSYKHKLLHPTINLEEIDPECDLDYVANYPRKWSGKNILKCASGFSGVHAAIVLQDLKEEVK